MEQESNKKWYVQTPEGVFGPYTSQELKRFGEEGHVRSGYLVRKGENGKWVKAESIRGLRTLAPLVEPIRSVTSQVPTRPRATKKLASSRTSPLAIATIIGIPVLAMFLVGMIVVISSQVDESTSNSVSSGRIENPPSVREIVQTNEQSVLLLRGKVASGTGFVVGDRLLVTNSHVVSVAALDPATGEFTDLKAYSPAADPSRRGPFRISLAYEDPEWDLAVLELIDPVTFRPIPMAKNYAFQRGEPVTIIGNPGLFEGRETLETAVSTGILSTTHPINGREHYQLGAAVNGGNSGGPVFGENGEVIGVVVSKSRSEDEISFCIPVREAIRAVEFARKHTALTHQFLWKAHNEKVPKAMANLALPAGTIATVVSSPPLSFVLVSSSEDDLFTASEYVYAGNMAGMQQLVASGRVMMVDGGTRVQVIDSNVYCRVRILEGLFTGRTGLVAIRCLK